MAKFSIFNERPDSWTELQEFVGRLFKEIGFEVESPKVIELVRGKKEVDVYVRDILSEYKPVILIECKYWKNPVDQEVVHSFHTIMNGFGANTGFIVSKNGFQKGSYQAAANTNIKLVSLEELEEAFYLKWQNGMVKKFLPLANSLFPYWDPSGGKAPKDNVSLNWDESELLSTAYSPIVTLGEWDLHGEMKRMYPMNLPVLDDKFKVIGEVVLSNDRDYFDFIEQNKEKAFKHYRLLYRE